ncbi:hypothetical protein Sango_1117100 [Sesamum angolense]|uniref:CRAL-TRIO domain-containing protein n=1 Tax=Sesamum angolense TaxID=2727404 RepID=A0AAE1WV43_9LAMI|nr:hypothetical protein Sango_1117100 [Sesamum angolense]
MDQNQELAVARLRESVHKLGGSTQRCGDLTLMRFLIARSMDVEKAAKMFVQWQKWRTSFVPLNYIPESEIPDELSAEKIYLQGLSRKGFPVLLVKVKKHFPAKDQLQFKKFVVYILDKTIARNVDARGLITGFQFLQAYYPERLAKCYLLHMPSFFVRVWRFVSCFLEKATLEKIVIVTSEEETREFMRDVGEDALPEEYGGKAKLMLLQDVVLTPLDN